MGKLMSFKEIARYCRVDQMSRKDRIEWTIAFVAFWIIVLADPIVRRLPSLRLPPKHGHGL